MSDREVGGYFFIYDVDAALFMRKLLPALVAETRAMSWHIFGIEHPDSQSPEAVEEAVRYFPTRMLMPFFPKFTIHIDWFLYKNGMLQFDEPLVQQQYLMIKLIFPIEPIYQNDYRALGFLANCWLHACEEAGVDFAYFDIGFLGPTPEWRDKMLRVFLSGNLQDIFIGYANSLIYIAGKHVDNALTIPHQVPPSQSPQRLHSGALFVFNPDQSPSMWYEPYKEADFLMDKMREYETLPGVSQLLERLQDIYDADMLFWSQLSSLPKPLPPRPDLKGELRRIHTLCATASRRASLVGVQQHVADVLVPIFARDGHEWVLWVDEPSVVWFTAEQQRLKDMVDVAHQQLIVPLVVVVFWQGVTPEVEHAVHGLGADVEVPPFAIPFIA